MILCATNLDGFETVIAGDASDVGPKLGLQLF